MPNEKSAPNLLFKIYADKALDTLLEKPWLVLIEMVWFYYAIILTADPANSDPINTLVFNILYVIAILGVVLFTVVLLSIKLSGKKKKARKILPKKPSGKLNISTILLAILFVGGFTITIMMYISTLVITVFYAFFKIGQFLDNIWLGFLILPILLLANLIYYYYLTRGHIEKAESVAKTLAVFFHLLVLIALGVLTVLN